MMKKILLFIFILILSSCSTKENLTKETRKIEKIELEDKADNGSGVTSKDFFYKNPLINSEIYKKYFYDYELLPSSRMESVNEDKKIWLKGSDIPIATDFISLNSFINYSFDKESELLEVASIIKKKEKIKDKILQDDLILLWIYNTKTSKLESLKQEDKDGNKVEIVDFNEDQWREISTKYKDFLIQIAS